MGWSWPDAHGWYAKRESGSGLPAPIDRLADGLAVAAAASLPWSTTATGILIALWLFACLASIDLIGLRRVLATPVGGLPPLLWAVGVVGMLWAAVPWWDRLHGVGGFNRFLIIPLLLAQYRRSDNGRWVLAGYVVSCMTVLAVSLATLVWRHVWRPDGPGVPFHDQTSQSAEFMMCASGLGYLAYESWRAGRLGRAAARLAVALGFLGNVLFVATARTEFVVAAALIPLAGGRARGVKGAIAGCVALVALAAVAWSTSSYLRGRVEEGRLDIQQYVEKNEPTSAGMRLQWWRESIPLIAEAPLFGHGTGTINSLFAGTGSDDENDTPFATTNPHNQTIVVAVQLGLVGVLALYVMWVSQFLLFRAPGLYGWLGLTVVVQSVVGSLFNTHLFDFVTGWTYVWGVGVIGGIILRAESGSVAPLPTTGEPAAEALPGG